MLQHLKRLKYYKYLFFFSTTVQIFVVVCGLYFLFQQFTIETSFEDQFATLERNQELYSQLKKQVTQNPYPQNENPQKLKAFYISMGKIENLVQQIGHPNLTSSYREFESKPQSPMNLLSYEEAIAGQNQPTLYKLFSQSQSNKNVVIILGILSLFFGLILPLIIIAQVAKLLRQVQKDINDKAVQISSDWIREKNRHGDDAFKNVEFWAKIGLTSIGQSSQMSSNPVAILVGDLALQIRAELDRQNSEPPTNENKDDSSDKDNIHSL